MAEAATAQLFRDNGMNIWHGVAPQPMSAFFSLGARVPRLRAGDWHSEPTLGQPLGRAVASSLGYTAQNFTPGSAPQRKPSNKRLVPFFAFCGPISGVEIWTQNWVHQVAQQLKSGRKPDPVFGPTKLAWFVPGASLLQPFFPHVG